MKITTSRQQPTSRQIALTAGDLRSLPPEKLKQVLSELGQNKAEELRYLWPFWARQEQLEPEGDWNIWIALAGRGWGKTRAGVEWVREQVKSGKKRIAAVAPTNSDIRRVMVEGESGFLNVCWKGDKTHRGGKMGFPVWSPTNRTLTWENGAKVEFYSAEDPERLRGPQFHAAWADEVAAWRNQQDVWDMLQFTLRLGRKPRVMVTTTPKPTKLMRGLIASPDSYITRGSTFDNVDNLAKPFLDTVRKEYEGTRLGRQELYAEILEEADGALWTTEMLDQCTIERSEVPELNRIVVAVDPAVTAKTESDMTGIIVAGVDVNGIGYVLEDATDRFSPQQWAAKAISLYREYSADRIVAERNQGGEMVRRTLEAEDETVPIRLVHASRGKMARAEPISALYEKHKVKHVKGLDELETQMRTWEPLGSLGSPDRLDACVWALTELMHHGNPTPTLRLAYSSAKGLVA
jgi:phage terminase large subunit-like protein